MIRFSTLLDCWPEPRNAVLTKRGEEWTHIDFETMVFNIRHSYYWPRGGHLKATKTEASARLLPMHPVLKQALLEWKSQNHYTRPEDFVFPSHRFKGQKPLDLAAVLKRQIKPAFAKQGISRIGWHTFRHTVGTMLAEMGEHQLTIRDYLRTASVRPRTNWWVRFCPWGCSREPSRSWSINAEIS